MKRLLALCLLTALLAGPGPARPSSVLTPDDIAVMMRAMLVMTKIWNAAQGVDTGDYGNYGNYGNYGAGWPQALSYATPWTGNSTSAPGMAMWPYMAAMMGLGSAAMSSYLPGASNGSNSSPWLASLPGNFLNPWSTVSTWPGIGSLSSTPLSLMGLSQPWGMASMNARPRDGTWLSANGNLMSIQGEHFVFEDSESVSGYGWIEVQGGRIVLHDQLSGSSGAYRIKLGYDQFTLLDEHGRTQTFQRIARRNTPLMRDLLPRGNVGTTYPLPRGTVGTTYPLPRGTVGTTYPLPQGTVGTTYPLPQGTVGTTYPLPQGTVGTPHPLPQDVVGTTYPQRHRAPGTRGSPSYRGTANTAAPADLLVGGADPLQPLW